MPERFTETLRAASEAGWSHAVQHRFVNELFAGAVPDAVMARYLIQDHRFLAVSARHTAAPVSTDRPTRRFRHQARLGPGFEVGPSGRRLDRDRRTARQSAGKPKHRGLGFSQARRLGDAVDPAALLFGRGKSEPELFLQGSREDAANGMTLPASHARHLVDRCSRHGRRQHL
jgi:hypothetical protein